jgi:cytoskeleton protein RodZ
MTGDELPPEAVAEGNATVASEHAGAMLARAREAAGLSVEGIAQQLKLAPRQVRALEESDFAALPGRTFVRGFLRNYARLVHLDPAEVLAALPTEGADPALTRPALATQARAMGEIPAEHTVRRPWTRWAIPLALVAIVAVAVAYERLRPPATALAHEVATPAPAASDTPPTAAAPDAPTAAGMALPNPAAAHAAADIAPAPASSTGGSGPSGAGAPGSPAPVQSGTPAGVPGVATPATSAAANGSGAPAVAASASASSAAPLELAFRGVSWIEVKDAKGATLLNMTGGPGAAQSLRATPPLDIVVGNADFVDVTFRGARVDLAPYTRQNIARLTLR